jgi:hypothetical protein
METSVLALKQRIVQSVGVLSEMYSELLEQGAGKKEVLEFLDELPLVVKTRDTDLWMPMQLEDTLGMMSPTRRRTVRSRQQNFEEHNSQNSMNLKRDVFLEKGICKVSHLEVNYAGLLVF